MKKGGIAIIIVCSILLMGFVSAGFFDSIKSAITGKVSSGPTNVSVSITGTNPVTIGPIENGTLTGGVDPIEDGSTTTTIYGTVCDSDGVNDIDDSSVQVQYTKVGETTRQNLSCSLVGDLDSNCANYSCSVDMWYWDGNGEWIINFSATDLGNGTTISNNSFTFSYNQLKAMVITPPALTWPALSSGATNQDSSNDPTVINNTGNYDGTVDITGINLYGETTTTEIFGVGNFTADETDSTCGAGTVLVNGTATTIVGTDSNPGNLSAGAGAGQEEVYYCIPLVPSLSSQTYSTDQSESWTILYP